MTDETASRFEIYQVMRNFRSFGWRYCTSNGQISAISAQHFTCREHANQAIHDFLAELRCVEPHPPILDA